MNTDVNAGERDASTEGSDRVGTWFAMASLGIVIGYIAALAELFVQHQWILDARGRPILTDFIAVWSAGGLALKGAAAAAYNGALQHAADFAALGRGFHGEYGWPYPPGFLFVAETLARFPYALAFVVLLLGSLSLYGLSIAAVTRRRAGAIIAFAAPWTLGCAIVGQNGFLTGGLFALVLLNIEKRPVVSGLLLGLLTYKPQFGLLIPLALVMNGRWKVIAWAAVSTTVLTALSVKAFGVDTFLGFIQALPRTTQTLVTDGGVGWGKLQSVYGVMRCLGASNSMGWATQGCVMAAGAILVGVIWRGRAAYDLKAASLALAAVVVTPYIFAYDLPLLGVAAAFVYRHRPFDRLDYAALAAAALGLAPILVVSFPFGVLAYIAIGGLVGRRLVARGTEAPVAATMAAIA